MPLFSPLKLPLLQLVLWDADPSASRRIIAYSAGNPTDSTSRTPPQLLPLWQLRRGSTPSLGGRTSKVARSSCSTLPASLSSPSPSRCPVRQTVMTPQRLTAVRCPGGTDAVTLCLAHLLHTSHLHWAMTCQRGTLLMVEGARRRRRRDCWEERRVGVSRKMTLVFLRPLIPCPWTYWAKRRMRSRWTVPALQTRKTALCLHTPKSPLLHPPRPCQMALAPRTPTGHRPCLLFHIWTTTMWLWVDRKARAPPTARPRPRLTQTATTRPPTTPRGRLRSAPAAVTLWTRKRWSPVLAAVLPAFAFPLCASEPHLAETPTRTWTGTTQPHVAWSAQDPKACRHPPPPAWSQDWPYQGRRHKPWLVDTKYTLNDSAPRSFCGNKAGLLKICTNVNAAIPCLTSRRSSWCRGHECPVRCPATLLTFSSLWLWRTESLLWTDLCMSPSAGLRESRLQMSAVPA